MIHFKSPNKEIAVQFKKQNNEFFYDVIFKGKKVLFNSKVGIAFKSGMAFPINHDVIRVERKFHDNAWELPWGEKKVVRVKSIQKLFLI